MSGADPKFELAEVFASAAARLSASRAEARAVHHAKDIRAAGDQVEQSVRDVLRSMLPDRVHVGHGHVLDRRWISSTQLDVILADRHSIPALFKTVAGVEYFPYEGVFGWGGVKTTYRAADDPIGSFCDAVSQNRARLDRDDTPPDWIPGFSLGTGFTVENAHPYRNPLLRFMIFVDSGDFRPSDINSLFAARPVDTLPNIICFVDGGVILNATPKLKADGTVGQMTLNIWPEFSADDDASKWLYMPCGGKQGASLGLLLGHLLAHLDRCTLMPPAWTDYFREMFGSPGDVWEIIG